MVQEHKKEIASHPLERKMWTLRKFYAGNGGVLPPTDPRILAMTEAQIDIEMEHIRLDAEERAKAGKEQVYVDEDYEREEAEEERRDSKLFMDDDDDFDEEDPLPKSENDDDDEWEDVEIDDF
jgi:hypothetical protein